MTNKYTYCQDIYEYYLDQSLNVDNFSIYSGYARDPLQIKIVQILATLNHEPKNLLSK